MPWQVLCRVFSAFQIAKTTDQTVAVRYRVGAVKATANVRGEIATTASCPAPVGGARQALFFRLPLEGSTETVLGKYGFAGTLVTEPPQYISVKF